MPPHSSRKTGAAGASLSAPRPGENVHRLPDCLIAFVNDKAFANDNEDKAVYSVTSRRQDNRTPSGLSQARGGLGRGAAMLRFAAKPSILVVGGIFLLRAETRASRGTQATLPQPSFPGFEISYRGPLKSNRRRPCPRRGKMQFGTPERWQSGRMRRFAKPLYGLTPVPRVRIPPSPPSFQLLTVHQITLQIS